MCGVLGVESMTSGRDRTQQQRQTKCQPQHMHKVQSVLQSGKGSVISNIPDQMKMMWAVVLLVWQAAALHIDTESSSETLQATLENTVVLIPSKTQCDKGEKITVDYQRIDNTRNPSEKTDFIGLFRKDDPTALVAYDVALVGESAQTGQVKIKCKKAGEMEIRMVRIPGKIIGRAPITVFAACAVPDCNTHGTCVRGACVCASGWEGDSCDLLGGDGLSIGWVENPTGEFYPGDEIKVKVSHAKTENISAGMDMINVYSVKSPSFAIQK